MPPHVRRRIVVPAIGIVVSAGAMMAFAVLHSAALRAGFQTLCDDQTHAIERHLETNINLLRAVQAFAQESPSNDWGAMHQFVENFSLLAKDVARYYWWNAAISPALVQPLEAYPEDSARVSFAVDAIRPLIVQAGQKELPVAGFLPGRSASEKPLSIVVLAVLHPGQKDATEGVILAFDGARLIDEALTTNISESVQLKIHDSRGNFLYDGAPRPRRGMYLGRIFEPTQQSWKYSGSIPFGDSSLLVSASPTGRVPNTDALACWGVFGFGLLLTAIIDTSVEKRRREATAMRGIVKMRSLELSEAKTRLQAEIAEKESAEASLRESEERFHKAYADAAVGTILTDLEGGIVAVNRSACRLTGFSAHRLIGSCAFDLIPEGADRVEARQRADFLLGGRSANHFAERKIRRKDATIVWLRISASVIESDGKPINFFAVLEDITEQVVSRQQLEFHASHDALTGLLNRRAFEIRLAESIGRARTMPQELALMYIDLDGFKFVNDSLGHATGDVLLGNVASRLRENLILEETLARVGGDEFTVILASGSGPGDIKARAQKVLDALRQPFHVNGHELFLSASIGISRYPADGSEASVLVQHADAAMYQAKRAGRGRFRFFTAEMAETAAARLSMESDLRRALVNNELEVHFQPLVSSLGKGISRFEALCRWRRGGGEYVPPKLFVPIAEESGLIMSIGAWVLEEACRQAKRWNRVSPVPIRVAVNVSFVQLGQIGFVSDVVRALESARLPASLLELELTESAVMRDPEQTLRILEELRRMGVSLTLDDFGTGYSSLSHLHGIPLEAVKIDQSFISGMTDPRSAQLVSSLISLAHGLGLEVVGEGIELSEQAATLRSLGCDLLQGYFFGKPMHSREALLFLENAVGRTEPRESLLSFALATQDSVRPGHRIRESVV